MPTSSLPQCSCGRDGNIAVFPVYQPSSYNGLQVMLETGSPGHVTEHTMDHTEPLMPVVQPTGHYPATPPFSPMWAQFRLQTTQFSDPENTNPPPRYPGSQPVTEQGPVAYGHTDMLEYQGRYTSSLERHYIYRGGAQASLPTMQDTVRYTSIDVAVERLQGAEPLPGAFEIAQEIIAYLRCPDIPKTERQAATRRVRCLTSTLFIKEFHIQPNVHWGYGKDVSKASNVFDFFVILLREGIIENVDLLHIIDMLYLKGFEGDNVFDLRQILQEAVRRKFTKAEIEHLLRIKGGLEVQKKIKNNDRIKSVIDTIITDIHRCEYNQKLRDRATLKTKDVRRSERSNCA